MFVSLLISIILSNIFLIRPRNTIDCSISGFITARFANHYIHMLLDYLNRDSGFYFSLRSFLHINAFISRCMMTTCGDLSLTPKEIAVLCGMDTPSGDVTVLIDFLSAICCFFSIRPVSKWIDMQETQIGSHKNNLLRRIGDKCHFFLSSFNLIS